jgi:hypothetical protein
MACPEVFFLMLPAAVVGAGKGRAMDLDKFSKAITFGADLILASAVILLTGSLVMIYGG